MAFYQGLNNTIYMFGSLIKDRINSSPYTLFILVFLIGLLVRIIFPELKLLHHDEAIHAWFTYDLITKGTYLYDPMYHGPLLYYLTGAAFFLFHDSDIIARFLPALFGTGIIPLIFLLYRGGWLTRNHALWAALFFSLSPSMVYFSRFLRHDIFQLFFTVLLLFSLLMYLDRGKWQYAITAAVSAACGLCLKEDMPFTLLIFGSFFGFMLMRGRISLPERWIRDLTAGLLVMAGIGLVCYTTFFMHPEMFIQAPFKAIEHWMGVHGNCRLCGGPYWYLLILGLYELPLAALAVIGIWQYGFREGGFSGIVSAVREYLPAGSGRDGLFQPYTGIPDKSRFLMLFALYWMILSMIFYAYVGEKVPWLVIHQLFPLILLASYRIEVKKIWLASITVVYLLLMTAHVCYTPADINEPIVQVQNSEEMRDVMELIDQSDSVMVTSESYWPLPWYYRGSRWNKISFYGHTVEPSVVSEQDPDMVIAHDTDSYESLPGYEKRRYRLSYWFSWYDNQDRLAAYYLFRDGKSGSINLDVFVRSRIGGRVPYAPAG